MYQELEAYGKYLKHTIGNFKKTKFSMLIKLKVKMKQLRWLLRKYGTFMM